MKRATKIALTIPNTRKPSEVAYWLPRLREASDAVTASLETARDKAIELGRRLIEAKAALPYGEFGKLFNGHPEKVAGHLTISRVWATRVMAIASNPVTADLKRALNLPSGIETIAELALMSAPALEAAIDAGKVRPDMTRAEAKALKNESKAKVTIDAPSEPKPPKDDRRFDLDHRYGMWSDHVDVATRNFLEDLPDAKEMVRDYLLYLIRVLCK